MNSEKTGVLIGESQHMDLFRAFELSLHHLLVSKGPSIEFNKCNPLADKIST